MSTAPGDAHPAPATPAALDPFDVRLAMGASGLLRAFNVAGVLAAADVHVATRLAALAGETDDAVRLAAALAVRAPRLGHVFVDLARIRETATVDTEEAVDLSALPWPDPATWTERVAAGRLAGIDRPLRLHGTALYLDRYWREEAQVARDLRRLSAPVEVDRARLDDGLRRLFPGGDADADQRRAAATAVARRLAVVAGGPGTGKTTTVARIAALLEEPGDMPLVALAAPTGKAAARLQEAVHESASELDVPDAVRDRLRALQASTLHRLLGWRPGSHSRFRHDRTNRLPHDVVIVDETSMVSLSLMARLLDAIRPDARLVLVGDPGQLTSIEAGAVLGDIVGPPDAPPDGVTVLRRIHRFGGGIQRLAEAIRTGDPDAAVEALGSSPDVSWLTEGTQPIREAAVAQGRAVHAAALAGDARAALGHLASFRLLCAHRHGPYGVGTWAPRVEAWLADAIPGFTPDGPGRPLLVTVNDHALRLYNGDTGVIVTAPDAGRPTAAFERQGEIVSYSPARLSAVETVHAMTVHKSQGSQFTTAAVVLPEVSSSLLTRELLYTAVTRARRRLIVAGPEEAVRAAVARPIARASGLRERLA